MYDYKGQLTEEVSDDKTQEGDEEVELSDLTPLTQREGDG